MIVNKLTRTLNTSRLMLRTEAGCDVTVKQHRLPRTPTRKYD